VQRNILVVDDDADIRESLVEILQGEGYTVSAATNGREGLEQLAAMEGPCLVLLDLMMPVMNGYEVLAQLRANPATRAIPVLILTASRTEMPEGATHLLRKPFELGELLSVVETHCPPG
jgi:CheY-like chemotaxis protein